MSWSTRSELLHEARRVLGIDQLVLAIHDASFPSASGEDIGRGSPYSRGAEDLFAFARELGFTGVQLGPQGETTLVNQSPYDGTVFSKSVLSIDFPSLMAEAEWGELIDADLVRRAVAEKPAPRDARGGLDRVQYAYVFRTTRALVRDTWKRFAAQRSPVMRERYDVWRAANAVWLDHDEAYEQATEGLEIGGDAFAFGQFMVHAQHHAARAEHDWTTYGDLQVGLSMCDRWRREALFLDGYWMGAPPSRTDPSGQPWGYPLFDPASEEATTLLRMRAQKMLREMDGLRIDHPHGIVCPWVYDAGDPDAMRAVQGGARLFESPDLPDHPRLARYAIARQDQLDRTVTRHADGWVRTLDDAQVTAYARRFDDIVDAVRAEHGLENVVCEVLSTQPYPLCRVMERHALGRFRVTQKANPHDKADGYRSENARPHDWIMVGNHDTAPLLMVVDRWRDQGQLGVRAEYLEDRLALGRDALQEDAIRVTHAMFAELFVSEARNVMVFVTDLLGIRAIYNRPGIVDDINWTWRVPNDFRATYAANCARGEALNIGRAMAMAMRAKSDATRARTDIIEALER